MSAWGSPHALVFGLLVPRILCVLPGMDRSRLRPGDLRATRDGLCCPSGALQISIAGVPDSGPRGPLYRWSSPARVRSRSPSALFVIPVAKHRWCARQRPPPQAPRVRATINQWVSCLACGSRTAWTQKRSWRRPIRRAGQCWSGCGWTRAGPPPAATDGRAMTGKVSPTQTPPRCASVPVGSRSSASRTITSSMAAGAASSLGRWSRRRT